MDLVVLQRRERDERCQAEKSLHRIAHQQHARFCLSSVNTGEKVQGNGARQPTIASDGGALSNIYELILAQQREIDTGTEDFGSPPQPSKCISVDITNESALISIPAKPPSGDVE
ncbi:hypothetical protein [Mycolicibacterium hodleri]|uniref:Uncharacterized protein n=1 Tax=Mycolicibacterium hodleri TaxID=49897 RepID=A0A502E975_9MYCO|nr:hypothetical protein [Mycolicibacterium hodleri]TPG34183.1 hypothetical protein EAH80_11285 [Mycolicibacterium hodleri]